MNSIESQIITAVEKDLQLSGLPSLQFAEQGSSGTLYFENSDFRVEVTPDKRWDVDTLTDVTVRIYQRPFQTDSYSYTTHITPENPLLDVSEEVKQIVQNSYTA